MIDEEWVRSLDPDPESDEETVRRLLKEEGGIDALRRESLPEKIRREAWIWMQFRVGIAVSRAENRLRSGIGYHSPPPIPQEPDWAALVAESKRPGRPADNENRDQFIALAYFHTAGDAAWFNLREIENPALKRMLNASAIIAISKVLTEEGMKCSEDTVRAVLRRLAAKKLGRAAD